MAIKKELLDKLIEDVLVWGIADYIDASAISDFASEYTKENVRELSLAAIRECLLQGLMAPGFVQFVPWNLCLTDAMEKIKSEIRDRLHVKSCSSVEFLIIRDRLIYNFIASIPPRTVKERSFRVVCDHIWKSEKYTYLLATEVADYIREAGLASTYNDLEYCTLAALEIGIREGAWLPGKRKDRYWQVPPEEAYEIIEHEWRRMPERLRFGDFCWFRLTEKGREVANQIAEHYDRD